MKRRLKKKLDYRSKTSIRRTKKQMRRMSMALKKLYSPHSRRIQQMIHDNNQWLRILSKEDKFSGAYIPVSYTFGEDLKK